jgi:Carboxypeptidase regulatory-like domain
VNRGRRVPARGNVGEQIRNRLFSSLLFVVALCYGGVVFGQTAEGAGRVSDQNAAVIPDTEIVITNAETGVIRKAATNAEGYYSIPLLRPGNYRLTAQKAGFKPVAHDNITLAVGQTARFDFTLTAGNMEDVVNITEQTALLGPETSSLGQVIDNKKITNIPLNGRSPFRLVQITPFVLAHALIAANTKHFRPAPCAAS